MDADAGDNKSDRGDAPAAKVQKVDAEKKSESKTESGEGEKSTVKRQNEPAADGGEPAAKAQKKD